MFNDLIDHHVLLSQKYDTKFDPFFAAKNVRETLPFDLTKTLTIGLNQHFYNAEHSFTRFR